MKIIAKNILPVSKDYVDFLDYFITHSKNKSFYNIPRFYIGGINQNFNTHQMISLSNHKNWYDNLVAKTIPLVELENPGHNFVRECITCIANENTSNYEFYPTNFLDSICVRVHVVLFGSGIISNKHNALPYEKGDVILFNKFDNDTATVCKQQTAVAHQVFSLSHESNKDIKSWDLFSKTKLFKEFL